MASALAVEIVVAAVQRVVVNTAEILVAAGADFCRPLSAAVASCHVLVEGAETTGLDLFTRLSLQSLMGTVLRVVTFEWGRVMCWICMGCGSRVRVRVLGTSVMLWMGIGVGLGLRLGFHVDSLVNFSGRGHSLFLTRIL